MKGSNKVDWHGVPDSSPSSSSERNPLDQPERSKGGGKVDWKGMPDGSPGSSSDRDGATGK